MLDKFKLVSPYKPTGDQPEAIEKLVEGINRGDKEQVLLGVTGSGFHERSDRRSGHSRLCRSWRAMRSLAEP